MKNFSWFLNQPADEREAEVFNKAYRRSSYTMWEILTLAWVFHPLNVTVGGRSIELTELSFLVPLLLVLSYFAGWLSLRKEDLAYKPKKQFLP